MMATQILPELAQADIQQASLLIQGTFTPGQNVEESRRMQQQLFEIQKRPEAWGLILPLLEHPDPNVQFFGAHTAQVKIARDWSTFPPENALRFAFVLIDYCARIISSGKSKVTLRKLFVAISSLALKLVPGRPPQWPNWLLSVITSLSGRGARQEHILEFLQIAAQEVGSSDLVSASKSQMQQSLADAVPMVSDAIKSTLLQPNASPNDQVASFKCLEAWISVFNASAIMELVPILVQLLSNESTFIGTSDVLQEILTASSLADGSGTKTLTEPLLAFLETTGSAIVQNIATVGEVDEISHSLCKLLVALGDHSINYIALHLAAPRVQNFVRLLFSYTALPGFYGIDEEESEMTLSFWYLLQESLWSVDWTAEDGEGGTTAQEAALLDWVESRGGKEREVQEDTTSSNIMAATPIYTELIKVLRRKVTWPRQAELAAWPRDQVDKFTVYRRDTGDTLLNAYYVLRTKMLEIYITDLLGLLNSRTRSDSWEDVEAILHCIMSVHEAVELQNNEYIERLFGHDIIGHLPRTGCDKVRRTALSLIGEYASIFTVFLDERYLLGALSYVADSLDEPTLCLTGANALRQLCDDNRAKLANHVSEFGQLHARLPNIPDSEKPKIVQSISSIIQALPPEQEIEPIHAIVSPLVGKLAEALGAASQLPEEARNVAVLQLQAITGCAKGLTRPSDVLFSYDENDKAVTTELERLNRARADPRIAGLRDTIVQAIQSLMLQWSSDATTADAINGLIIAITALPADITLLSLPPGPLLQIVCSALQNNVNAVWLSLTTKLIHQLDPPSMMSLLATPSEEAKGAVLSVMPVILDACLNYLRVDDNMRSNPDIVQAFFGCMEITARHFVGTFFQLPAGAIEALMQCSVTALSLQERYSLVSACKFLVALLNRTIVIEDPEEHIRTLIKTHFRPVVRAVLSGIAGGAPTSTTQNLVDLILALVSRDLEDCKIWIPDILFSDPEFVNSKASRDDRDKFARAVLASRSTKRTREAAQQFALVAKGLEGTSFGYASVTM